MQKALDHEERFMPLELNGLPLDKKQFGADGFERKTK
jgi:hypothetical protein